MKQYKRQYVDDNNIDTITQKEYLEQLQDSYKEVTCFDDLYYGKDKQIRTPFAYFWCESV